MTISELETERKRIQTEMEDEIFLVRRPYVKKMRILDAQIARIKDDKKSENAKTIKQNLKKFSRR